MRRTEILSSIVIAKNKWTTIVKETFRLPKGVGEYLIVERQPALMVIPLLNENDIWYTYLVKQHRYPINNEVWQFPMGTLENDDPEKHALDELEEETGLRAKDLIQMGEYYVDPGLSRQKCLIFIAQGLTPGVQRLDETEEGMIVKKVRIKDLDMMVKTGEIQDGWGFAGLYYLTAYLKNQNT